MILDRSSPWELLEEEAQVSIGFEAACFGRLDEAEKRRPRTRPIGMSRKEPVLETDHETPNGILGGVVVGCDVVVFHIADQLEPMVQGIAERFAQEPVGRCQPDSVVDPGFELIEYALCLLSVKITELRR